MYDIRILKRIRLFADAMSQGINPLTGEYVQDGDTVSEERIQKCMEYVVGIVDEIINNGIGNVKRDFSITPEEKARVVLYNGEIGVNDMAKRINSVINTRAIKGITGSKISKWLVKKGYLSERSYEATTKKTEKILNDRSQLLGLNTRLKTDPTGRTYNQIVYPKKAQEFILEHIEEIASE